MLQTGKSYTLEHIVPAVVAEALCEQQQEEDGGGRSPLLANMVVLRLKGDELECSVRLRVDCTCASERAWGRGRGRGRGRG